MGSKNISSSKHSSNHWNDILAQFESYLIQLNRADESIKGYLSTISCFGGFYREGLNKSGPYVRKLQENDYYAYIDYLRNEKYLAASSVNRAVAALRIFTRFLIINKMQKKDISSELKTYNVGPKKEPKELSSNEVKRMVTAVNMNSKNGLRDVAIIQILLQCGLRVGEIYRLIVDDVTINKTSGNLKVRDKKTRSERYVPLNKSVKHSLIKFIELRGEISGNEPLFISERGTRLSIKGIQHLVKKYLCAIGRDDLTTHDLRHHFATKLYSQIGKLTAVQQVLGHRNLSTTARYLNTSESEIINAIEDLPDNIYHG